MRGAPIVEIENLVVRYGKSWGVQDISFTIGEGAVCGLIGPNGSGKSTTMKVISGLLGPQSGSARVLGWDVKSSPGWVRWHVGFMPDVLNLPDALSAWDYLRFAASAHALPPGSIEAAIDEVLALVDLSEHRAKEIGQLSKGMRQRLQLARTLLPQPRLLVLDEPASGLDPRARIEFRALVRELQRMGCTILISSHVLADLSEVCDSLIIIEEGKTVVAGTLEEIRNRLGARLHAVIETVSDPARLVAWLAARRGVRDVTEEAGKVRFAWDDDRQALAELVAALCADGHRFCSMTLERAGVEDVFLSFTKGIVS